jgi:hypothetical protein
MPFKRKPPPGNVRRVICLGNNFRGVTTNKRGHLVQFESEQEHKLILLLERDSTVADYASQPETLHFQDDSGRQRSYTPDFQVWRIDGGIELHEVTVEARRVARESLQQRETAAHAICGQRGWRYVVHTDETLPSGYEYTNLDFLAPFRAKSYATAEGTAWWLGQLAAGRSYPDPARNWQQLLSSTFSTICSGTAPSTWIGTSPSSGKVIFTRQHVSGFRKRLSSILDCHLAP